MEKALLRGTDWAQINMDYDKLFDKFDPDFLPHLNEAMGIPPGITFLFKDLYNNIQRRFRIGKHNGSNRGGGQGDSLWLLDAIIITSIQFKMIEATFPTVKLGIVVDDRNFRGPTDKVILAVQEALKYDKMASLDNNIKKFIALAATPEGKEELAQARFDDQPIKVVSTDTLVGTLLTIIRAPRRAIQNMRITEAIETTCAAIKTGVDGQLQGFVTMAAAIQKNLHGTLWVRPSCSQLGKLRTAALKAVWGPTRLMRCPEIVVAVLNTAVRIDPIAAIVYRGLCDTRRILRYADVRYQDFMTTLDLVSTSGMDIQGPASGFLSLLVHCGAECELSSGDIVICQSSTGKRISLCKGDDTVFKREISDLCTEHILAALTERVSGEESERKDMKGITPKTDLHATLGAHKANAHESLKRAAEEIRQNGHGDDVQAPCTKAVWGRYMTIVIAGACRYADRLTAAKIVVDNLCMHPECNGKSCDAKHWIYECPLNTAQSNLEAQEFIAKTATLKYNGQHRARALNDLYCRPCMHFCGMCLDKSEWQALPATGQKEQDDDIHNLYLLAANKEKAICSSVVVPAFLCLSLRSFFFGSSR